MQLDRQTDKYFIDLVGKFWINDLINDIRNTHLEAENLYVNEAQIAMAQQKKKFFT